MCWKMSSSCTIRLLCDSTVFEEIPNLSSSFIFHVSLLFSWSRSELGLSRIDSGTIGLFDSVSKHQLLSTLTSLLTHLFIFCFHLCFLKPWLYVLSVWERYEIPISLFELVDVLFITPLRILGIFVPSYFFFLVGQNRKGLIHKFMRFMSDTKNRRV